MTDLRAIAFYLPQYHPVPENDAWWGKGFTEWANVARAAPLFPGHYQPHLPADLGFYDLRVPEVREHQATLAKQYGIHGFCYYHYWFTGRRILERPFNEVLSSGKPDLPFCLCWANENWTRAWDGGDREVLLQQIYSHEDDLAHIRNLIPAFRDQRYIRINGKPLFLVYRTEHLPDAKRTAALWREECHRAGVGDIYLARVASFTGGIDPASIGFDAAVEFAPDWRQLKHFLFRSPSFIKAIKHGYLPDLYVTNSIVAYSDLARRMLARADPSYVKFRCVSPGFDNSPRRKSKAAIFVGATPQRYEEWLYRSAQLTLQSREGDERIIFINAWNEWGEGNHLEPDIRHGHGYLEATSKALTAAMREPLNQKPDTPPAVTTRSRQHKHSLKTIYWNAASRLDEYKQIYQHHKFNKLRKEESELTG